MAKENRGPISPDNPRTTIGTRNIVKYTAIALAVGFGLFAIFGAISS